MAAKRRGRAEPERERAGRAPANKAMKVVVIVVLAGALGWWLTSEEAAPNASSSAAPTSTAPSATGGSEAEPTPVVRTRPEILARHPHDPRAFTQGLLWHEGSLYESTGLLGQSTLRRWSPETGEEQRRLRLPSDLFAEGLAQVGERLFLLTYQAGRALVYDRESFELLEEHSYDGEGWGLTFDGTRLVMGDGTSRLVFRDPETFEEVRRLTVTLHGRPLDYVNELEWARGVLWANIWQTEEIVRIDPRSGAVTAVVEAPDLLDPEARLDSGVLNGIAYRPETDTFFLTGKNWPEIFEVRIDLPSPDGPAGPGQP